MKGKILALILCGCLAITGMTACSSNPDNNNSATDENAVDDDRKPTKTPSDGNEGSTVSPTGGAGTDGTNPGDRPAVLLVDLQAVQPAGITVLMEMTITTVTVFPGRLRTAWIM